MFADMFINDLKDLAFKCISFVSLDLLEFNFANILVASFRAGLRWILNVANDETLRLLRDNQGSVD